MRMSLNDIFKSQSILLNLQGITKEAIFIELADAIGVVYPECNKAVLLAALWERENKMSTGIVSGVAVPHASCKDIHTIAGAIGISHSGIEYGALDQKPVHVVFMLVMSNHCTENHLYVLNQILRLAQSEALELIRNAKNAQDIHSILSRVR